MRNSFQFSLIGMEISFDTNSSGLQVIRKNLKFNNMVSYRSISRNSPPEKNCFLGESTKNQLVAFSENFKSQKSYIKNLTRLVYHAKSTT